MNGPLSRVGITLAVGAALTLGGAVGAAAENFRRDASHDNKIAIRGCVIRFDERDEHQKTVPRVHANQAHFCVGVSSVSTDPKTGELVVRSETEGPIVSLAVSPDETLTERGITCGASGGGHVTRVRCFDRNGTRLRADGPELFGKYSNLWLSWTTWQDR